MPTIHRIGPFAIRLFTADHPPVHVHAYAGSFVAKVYLDGSCEIVRGGQRPPSGFGTVVDWVQANQATIVAAWERTRPR